MPVIRKVSPEEAARTAADEKAVVDVCLKAIAAAQSEPRRSVKVFVQRVALLGTAEDNLPPVIRAVVNPNIQLPAIWRFQR